MWTSIARRGAVSVVVVALAAGCTSREVTPPPCEEVGPELVDVIDDFVPELPVLDIGMVKTPDLANTWLVGARFYDGFSGDEFRLFTTNIPAVGTEHGQLIEFSRRGDVPDPNGGPSLEGPHGWPPSGGATGTFQAEFCGYEFGHWVDGTGDVVPFETAHMVQYRQWCPRLTVTPPGSLQELGTGPAGDTPHRYGNPTPVAPGEVPSDAAFTGYSRGRLELWLAESDLDRHAYLVWESGARRWFRGDPDGECVGPTGGGSNAP